MFLCNITWIHLETFTVAKAVMKQNFRISQFSEESTTAAPTDFQYKNCTIL